MVLKRGKVEMLAHLLFLIDLFVFFLFFDTMLFLSDSVQH